MEDDGNEEKDRWEWEGKLREWSGIGGNVTDHRKKKTLLDKPQYKEINNNTTKRITGIKTRETQLNPENIKPSTKTIARRKKTNVVRPGRRKREKERIKEERGEKKKSERERERGGGGVRVLRICMRGQKEVMNNIKKNRNE